MRTRRLKIYFDGGCQPNPGVMQTAVVARGQSWVTHDIGWGTNNDAEWLALIAAVNVAQEIGETDVILLGDSAIVVAQVNGVAKCRNPDLQAHLDVFQLLTTSRPSFRVRKIKRSQNLAGIALAAANQIKAACKP